MNLLKTSEQIMIPESSPTNCYKQGFVNIILYRLTPIFTSTLHPGQAGRNMFFKQTYYV